MLKEKIHRIPVVNEQQHVIGKSSKLLDAFQK
jgi:CBS domain-containing protein